MVDGSQSACDIVERGMRDRTQHVHREFPDRAVLALDRQVDLVGNQSGIAVAVRSVFALLQRQAVTGREREYFPELALDLAPVVTEPSKAIRALKWTVEQMEERYRMMASLGVRADEGWTWA